MRRKLKWRSQPSPAHTPSPCPVPLPLPWPGAPLPSDPAFSGFTHLQEVTRAAAPAEQRIAKKATRATSKAILRPRAHPREHSVAGGEAVLAGIGRRVEVAVGAAADGLHGRVGRALGQTRDLKRQARSRHGPAT